MSDDLISRQAAIETIGKMQTYKLFEGDDMVLVDKDEAQKELRLLPSAQPEKCEDAVSREEAKWVVFCHRDHVEDQANAIDELPSVRPSAQPETPSYVAEIESEYKKWVSMPHINKPLAKALYEVWKKHDREDVSRNG